MARLDWVLSIQDKISGPAGKITRQLGELRIQLKKLDVAAKENALGKITDPLKKQRAELQLHRDKLLLSKAAMEKHGGAAHALGERLKGGREALRDWLLILDPIARGMHFVADRAMEMGKRIVSAVSFKQGAMIGLESLFGAKGGADVFERMALMASRIGKPIEHLVELARSLATVGFKQSDIEPMVRLIEDLDALDPGAGDKLAHVLEGVKSRGFATVGDVEAMRGTRISEDKIFAKLGNGNRIAGKAMLEQLNSAGTGIPPNLFAQMMLGEVLGLEGGRAGSSSAKAGDTLQGLLLGIEDNVTRMFGRLSNSKGIRAFQSVLRNVRDIFDPDSKTGQKTFKRLNELSTAVGKMLEPLTGPEGKKRMEDFFDSLTRALESALPLLSLAGGYVEAMTGVLAGKHAPGAPQSVGEELRQLKTMIFGSPLEDEIRKNVVAGEAGPRVRGAAARAVHVTVQVDARGASKDDAEHIAEKVKGVAVDAVCDALDRCATQQGAQ
jgi:hypothetical protein